MMYNSEQEMTLIDSLIHQLKTSDEEKVLDTNIRINKYLRASLDRELQYLKIVSKSRERSLAITKIQEAIMWLGMDLKRLNETSPYVESYNPENTVVHPTSGGLKM